MNVYLTFDVEVWCGGWDSLEKKFPAAYDRYIYGNSSKGAWGLPKTIQILRRHGLRGVFFVEPLFSARFGEKYLAQIVEMLDAAEQDIQLHLHPEWVDEIRPRLIVDSDRKRQHLSYYSLEEQIALISHGKRLLKAAGATGINAFRAGSYAANADTLQALQENDIFIDTSPNRWYEVSAPDLRRTYDFLSPFSYGNVSVYPVTIFRDGFGRDRPAQVNGTSFEELRDAMLYAYQRGQQDFVIVSHSFEMLKPGSAEPDQFVVRRFERLCALLERERSRMKTVSFTDLSTSDGRAVPTGRPRASLSATGRRYGEQLLRRFT